MFINYSGFFIFFPEFIFVNFLENIFETSVVSFQNSIFGRHVKRPFFIERHLHRRTCKAINRFVGVIHAQRYTIAFKIVHFPFFGFSVFVCKGHFECAFSLDHHIGSFVLIAKSMTADNDRLCPTRNQAWYI